MMNRNWVVITGANSGIGLEAAKQILFQNNFNVILSTRSKPIPIDPEKYPFVQVDLELSDENSVSKAAQEILNITSGKIAALFNNAGYALQLAMEDVPIQSLKSQFSANVFGPVQLTNLLLPSLMQTPNSKIIFEEDLAKDVLEIITVFSARLYGSRSRKNQKLLDGVKQAVEDAQSC